MTKYSNKISFLFFFFHTQLLKIKLKNIILYFIIITCVRYISIFSVLKIYIFLIRWLITQVSHMTFDRAFNSNRCEVKMISTFSECLQFNIPWGGIKIGTVCSVQPLSSELLRETFSSTWPGLVFRENEELRSSEVALRKWCIFLDHAGIKDISLTLSLSVF